jgi:hypothetical protein
MLRKGVGIALFFLGIGLWIIALFGLLLWSLPWIVLAFFAGWLSRGGEWPGMKHWRLWEWLRGPNGFNFKIEYGHLNHHNEQPVIYAIYPHGHFSLTALFYFALNPHFSGNCVAAVHSIIFYTPLFGSLARWLNAIGVTEKEMLATLKAGRSIFMCPGGVADIVNTGNDMKRRSGFLRVARLAGVKVVPIWCPDERSYYTHWLPLGWSLERILHFPIPIIIWGRWWCPILPNIPSICSRIRVGGCALDPSNEDVFWREMDNLTKL